MWLINKNATCKYKKKSDIIHREWIQKGELSLKEGRKVDELEY